MYMIQKSVGKARNQKARKLYKEQGKGSQTRQEKLPVDEQPPERPQAKSKNHEEKASGSGTGEEWTAVRAKRANKPSGNILNSV